MGSEIESKGIKYGYARVSTNGQAKNGNSLDDQKAKLYEAGAEKVIVEQYTGTTTDRPKFNELLEELKAGDILMVTKLDRFARSASKGSELVKELLSKGIKIYILNMGMMDNTPTGRLIASILFSFAEFERDMIVERTQEGKARAKANGKPADGGRPRIDKARITAAIKMVNDGMTYTRVAEATGISRRTIIKRVQEYRAKKNIPDMDV